MGVPVLALMGDSMISRQCASLLAAAGMADWIARSEEDAIRIAVQRSQDVRALAELRRGMRERLRGSPLVDAPRFAARFGELIAAMAAQAPAGAAGR